MRTIRLAACVALLLTISSGCGPTGNTDNTNGNSNDNGGTAPAPVGFPDAMGKDSPIVTINQGGDISASVIGTANDSGSPATITGLSGGTGSGDFLAEVDAELRTERITIGDTELVFDYGEGDSFNYSVNRGEEVVFQGSDLNVSRSTSQRAGRVIQQVGLDEVVACSALWTEVMATLVEVELTGDLLAVPEPEFVECLLGVEEVVQVSAMYCVSLLVFVPSLIETLLGCQFSEDPFICLDRVTPALEAISFFSDILLVILEDMISQIRLDDQFCASLPP